MGDDTDGKEDREITVKNPICLCKERGDKRGAALAPPALSEYLNKNSTVIIGF